MPHRFEAASTGRAGCSNKECKDNKVKIAKGELRVGSWIENEKFQSWAWRHWGCTTPKVLENIKSAWEETQGDSGDKDYSMLDGYDELSEDYQVKVRNALEQGHVDNEDWKGDVEMNIPGSSGFRVRKKKANQAKKDDDEKAKAADDVSDDEAEVKPKKRGRPAKAASTEKASPVETGTKRKATANGDNEATDDKPKRRGRPPKAQKTQVDDGEAVPEKPKRGRKKAEKKPEDK